MVFMIVFSNSFIQLEELDLSDNRLISLETLRDLPQKALNVKKLNLGKNRVSVKMNSM